jgi:hypothetical protein
MHDVADFAGHTLVLQTTRILKVFLGGAFFFFVFFLFFFSLFFGFGGSLDTCTIIFDSVQISSNDSIQTSSEVASVLGACFIYFFIFYFFTFFSTDGILEERGTSMAGKSIVSKTMA